MEESREKREESYKNYNRRLILSKEYGLGRKLEKIENFGKSFFKDNYYNAFMLTKRITDQNREVKSVSLEAKYDRSMKRERFYNIITFCGERGSGKTSVMDSIIQALQGESVEFKKFIRGYEHSRMTADSGEYTDLCSLLEDNRFICLDEIDASLLEEKENILDVVLSEMYHKLQNRIKNDSKNQLYESGEALYSGKDIKKKIDDIYQKRHNLLWRKENPYELGESSFEQLDALSGSLDIREDLQELIPRYLNILDGERDIRKYLVISIDDLDMHNNAYEMLEELHRYMMIPQVIIYVAVSEREIQSVCEKHFEDTYNRSSELAMSYLEKVLPYSRRIYLPAPYNGDLFDVVEKETDKEGVQVKTYLLRKIAQKTQVFYDICGLGTHFYEIGNLRTFLNIYYLFDDMKKIDLDILWHERDMLPKDSNVLDDNFNKLKNDVIGRMATEKLKNKEQYQIFWDYCQEDFSTNSRYLYGKILKILNKDREAEEWDYNYGNFLYALYMLNKMEPEYKPLIQCVLAMATIELTQNYMYGFGGGDKNSKIKWNEYISESLYSGWYNEIFPKIKEKKETAYVKDFTMERFSEILKKEIGSMAIEEAIDKDYHLIESFILLMMFIRKKNKIKDEVLLEQKYDFDILGFVMNSIDCERRSDSYYGNEENEKKNCENREDKDDSDKYYGEYWERYFKELENLFYLLMKKVYDLKEISGETKDNIDEGFSTIKNQYINWSKCYGFTVLPLYSMDIMYNLLNSVRKERKRNSPSVIESSDMLKELKEIYKLIGKHLKEEDDYFTLIKVKENGEKERKSLSYFYATYCLSPFMFPFMEIDIKTDTDRKFFKKGTYEEIKPSNSLPKLFERLFGNLLEEICTSDSSKSEG